MSYFRLPEFNLLNSPLQGVNLIEASAGTGKTFAITGLFLRLLLEKRLSLKDILVVTYTLAATEELRDRIRKKIREALEAYARGDSADPFLMALLQQTEDKEEAITILRRALCDFDQAAIFTIHGFCQRTLQESAFESGSLFDTELKPDQESGLLEEIVQDFWRHHFYHAPWEWVRYALKAKYRPALFLELLRNRVPPQDLKIVPEFSEDSTPPAFPIGPFQEALKKLKQSWPEVQGDIQERLSDPALFAEYGKNLFDLLALMNALIQGELPPFPLPKGFEKFTPEVLKKKTRKGKSTPHHPFFDLCDELKTASEHLQSAMDRQLLSLKVKLFKTLKKELPERKQRQNIQSFDDLLTRLQQALEKPGGDKLSRTIRFRYRAALIDEFQDTDPVQYAIFRNVFGQGEATLFLIGDPKQAIYSFRGADLFAYLKAASRVDARYTLTKNWRSEPGLIGAVNTLFSGSANPFLFDQIPFEKTTPGETQRNDFLKIEGLLEPSFHLWMMEAGGEGNSKAVTKGKAYSLIPQAVAAEISRLLSLGRNNQALLGDQPVCAADMAILTRTNREARLMQEALSELKIPSVLYSTGNLFDTQEALEMGRLLKGIANPHRERDIRAALTTDILGLDGESLEALQRDEAGWEEWLTRFRDYHNLWVAHGFIRMFRTLLSKEGVRPRLLSLPQGERRLTNVLHLSEVLHQVAMDGKLGMAALLKWLSRQCDPNAPRLEEHQLRLESDADAVKVVTIHKSKGLEYPIVFCPFNWTGSEIKPKEVFTFHDQEDDWQLKLVLDPESSPYRPWAEREALAENLRLLYVSMTRAKNRCYLVWGRFRSGETSALAYLLHFRGEGQIGQDIVEKTGTHFQGLTDEAIRQALETLADRSQGNIRIADMPVEPGEELLPTQKENLELTVRPAIGPIPQGWQLASFSSLTARSLTGTQMLSEGEMDLPDHDPGITPEEPQGKEEVQSIFAFPRGAKAGTLLHSLFERLDFTENNPESEQKLINRVLEEYGFDGDWQMTLSQMVKRVLQVPLPSPSLPVTLSQIPSSRRLNELEFYFPLKEVSPKKLRTIFADYGGPRIQNTIPARLEELHFSPAQGFMKGFIDLVFQQGERFFIVDWKSNFLGNRVEDYDQENMAREMVDNYYILQSHLYVLALHQYLKTRLPGYSYREHFGGVFYIFLRGVDPQKGHEYGVYHDFPGEELVEALSENLIEGYGQWHEGLVRK